MNAEPAPLLVVSGPTGVGKTTLARALASSFEPSAHVEQDAFLAFIRRGWVDPATPESAAQSHVLGSAIGSSAIEFAAGGYTVILDAQFQLEGVQAFAGWAGARAVAVHYVVLWADLDCCIERVEQRGGTIEDGVGFAALHGRFADGARWSGHLVDASRAADVIAAEVRARFVAGELRVG